MQFSSINDNDPMDILRSIPKPAPNQRENNQRHLGFVKNEKIAAVRVTNNYHASSNISFMDEIIDDQDINYRRRNKVLHQKQEQEQEIQFNYSHQMIQQQQQKEHEQQQQHQYEQQQQQQYEQHHQHFQHRIVIDSNIGFYFWSKDGESYMDRSGYLSTSTDDNDVFRIVSAPERVTRERGHGEGNGECVSIQTSQNASSQMEYISCGDPSMLYKGSCPCSFTHEITDRETFLMIYCEDDNTYIFKSWNGFYLKFGKILNSIMFTTCHTRGEDGLPKTGRWELRDNNRETGKRSRKTAVVENGTWAIDMLSNAMEIKDFFVSE